MNANQYPILLLWSEEDQAYIARVLDLAGCMADGRTVEEAIANAQVVISEWLETAREIGREIPSPTDNSAFLATIAISEDQQRKQFEQAVQATARKIIDQLLPDVVAKISEQLEAEYAPKKQGIFGRLALVHG